MKKVRCINANGPASGLLREGAVYTVLESYTFDGHTFYRLAETHPDAGWYPWRFVDDKEDFERFMERVMKPANLDQTVSA